MDTDLVHDALYSPEEQVLTALASQASGMTGADVEQVVRKARRIARRSGRPLTFLDVASTLDGVRPQLVPALRKRFAYHEAAHAVVSVALDIGVIEQITMSDEVGDPSTVFRLPTASAFTENQVMSLITVGLAGRAAEDLFFEMATVHSGGGPTSDLARVTKLAYLLETSFGFGEEHKFVYRELPDFVAAISADRVLNEKINRRLELCYVSASQLLQLHKAAVERLGSELLRKGTLDGAELRVALTEVKGMMEDNVGREVESKSRFGRTPEPKPKGAIDADYNALPLEDWKAEIAKDVKDRLGAVPETLIPTSESGL